MPKRRIFTKKTQRTTENTKKRQRLTLWPFVFSLVRHEACGKYNAKKPSGWKSHTSQDADQLEAVVIVLEETKVQKLM
ncbi:hypothetical protein, partial [Haliscomenobacter sp.]|uniref:hypothetical protein n=1 Tax=Haliscomenobacter sp. TaxID=2717303 RepID=UPI003594021E